jgi:mono/diheme cytochrome c family protein
MKLTGLLLTTALVAGSSLAMAANEGAALYAKNCAMCHGADGSKTMMKNRPLGAADVQKQTDAQLSEMVEKGKGRMPAFGKKLNHAQIMDIVAFIRTLKK